MRIAFTFNLQTQRSEAEAEFDTAETVGLITGGLERLGHEVHLVDVGDDLAQVIDRLRRLAPDLVFNTAEGRRGRGREALFPSLFEHLDLPYTGSDPLTCSLTLDKQLTKTVVARRGVEVARGFVVRDLGDLERAWDRFPAIIKPNSEGSSLGIDAGSIVDDRRTLEHRAAERLARYGPVLVEELIEGIDVVVPFLEAGSPATGGVLEPASYRYRRGGSPRSIYSYDMKLDGFSDLIIDVPAEINPSERAQAQRSARQVIEALQLRDLGRLDFRLEPGGRLVFLEANALPSLESGASLYLSGALAGLDTVESVLAAVIDSAVRRCGIDGVSCLDRDQLTDPGRAS